MIEFLPAQFMNWMMVGKTKIPVNTSGHAANVHDPANHLTYEAAVAQNRPVAFVLTADDPWFFLDLDKCLTTDGTWSAESMAIFQAFPGAMYEVSQSGTGLHIMGKCTVQQTLDLKNRWDGWKEFYTQKRFIAFGPTGWQPIGDTFNPDRDWTFELRRTVPARKILEMSEHAGRDPAWRGPEDDQELINRMMASAGGAAAKFNMKATFKQLWERDEVALAGFFRSEDSRSDGLTFDWSRADSALMFHLAFWTGRDLPRMDRLFRLSGLMRPKWDNHPSYASSSMGYAVGACTSVYQESSSLPVNVSGTDDGDLYLLVDEQIKKFEGCVYVRDIHRAFVPDGGLLKPDTFRSVYAGNLHQMQVDGARPTVNAWEAFVENRAHKFPKCNNITWDPKHPTGEIMNNAVNTYIPAKVDMKPGPVDRFLELLAKLLPDSTDQKIMLNWAASVVQNPGVKFQWAPVLQGAEGNGKTLFSQFISMAVGEELVHKPDSKNLSEKFNSYMERKVLIVVEEIDMQDKREMLDILKPLITNLRVEVRAMQQDKRMANNFANWLFLTNHRDAIMKSRDDRRYAIMFTAQQHAGDIIRDGMGGMYFPDLWQWARQEGFSQVAHYLHNYKIDPAFDPAGVLHRAPKTSSTDAAIKSSAGMIETEIMDAIEDGSIGFQNGWISTIKLAQMFKEKRIFLSKSKWSLVLGNLGYVPCPGLPNGRAPRTLMVEDNKRPKLYRLQGESVGTNPLLEYCEAQGYQKAPDI